MKRFEDYKKLHHFMLPHEKNALEKWYDIIHSNASIQMKMVYHESFEVLLKTVKARIDQQSTTYTGENIVKLCYNRKNNI